MMIFKKAIPRRTLLRGMGATLALPLLDAMTPAFAAPASAPLRMGFMYVPNGIIMNQWTPTAEGAGFQMTPTLEALAPFRDHLLVLSGLDQNQANALPGEGGSFHSRTSGTYLTGAHVKHTEGVDIHCGVSIDQVAAKELGKQTQVASLEISTDPSETAGNCEQVSCAYMNTLCWRTATTPLPMENQPRAVFERLFGDSDTTDAAARRAQMQMNRSLLDSFTKAVARLQSGLYPGDRAKLDQYLDSIRDIERRIQIAEQQSSRELPTLERPGGSLPSTFEQYAKLMFDLQVVAYQTDLTRVITFRVAREQSGRTYPEIGVPEAHHAVSHHQGNAKMIAKAAQINAYHIKLFASHFLEKLRSTPDGDGSLLDHTMIVYGAGMSDGNFHKNDNLPVLLVGGGAGQIKGGRHVRYPKGTPMTNLYLSVLNMMGIQLDKFGDSTGKLAGISAA